LAFARDIQASKVPIVSDCKNIITSLEEGSRGVYAQIIEEIVAAKEEFEEVSFMYEGRRKNKEKHTVWQEASCTPARVDKFGF
jgi:hypothetical protein